MEYGGFVFLVFLASLVAAGAWLGLLVRLTRALMEDEPALWLTLGSPRLAFPGAGGIPAWGRAFSAWIWDGGPGVATERTRHLVRLTRGVMITALTLLGLGLWCAWGLLPSVSGGGGGG